MAGAQCKSSVTRTSARVDATAVHGSTADHFVRLSGVRLQPADPADRPIATSWSFFTIECSCSLFSARFRPGRFIRSRTTCLPDSQPDIHIRNRYRISASASARRLAAAPPSGRNGCDMPWGADKSPEILQYPEQIKGAANFLSQGRPARKKARFISLRDPKKGHRCQKKQDFAQIFAAGLRPA